MRCYALSSMHTESQTNHPRPCTKRDRLLDQFLMKQEGDGCLRLQIGCDQVSFWQCYQRVFRFHHLDLVQASSTDTSTNSDINSRKYDFIYLLYTYVGISPSTAECKV